MRAGPIPSPNALAVLPVAAQPAGRLPSSQVEAPGPHHLSGAEVAVLDDAMDDRPSWKVDAMALTAFLAALVIGALAIGAVAMIVLAAVSVMAHAIGWLLALASGPGF